MMKSAPRRLDVRGEVAEILRCPHELLREPTFVSTLVGFVSGNGQSEETDFAGTHNSCVSGAGAK